MDLTVLGSGGCAVIPKPLCNCGVCTQARDLGPPYCRTGPSIYIHDASLLVDTPAESALQLNSCRIEQVKRLLLTHLDPDHVEGLRVVEQVALDFRNWRGYPDKKIQLLLPKELEKRIRDICTWYGPVMDYYLAQGYLEAEVFEKSVMAGPVEVTAICLEREGRPVFIYVFESDCKVVYAPCDIRPFPRECEKTHNADLLIIQPGIIEGALKDGFVYPKDHVSFSSLYTMEQTLALAKELGAKKVLFTHLEEYWGLAFDDYQKMEAHYSNVGFAWDGLKVCV